MLKQAGLRVKGINNGKDVVPALQEASRQGDPFDLCILDIGMPGMDGFDILREIRSLETPRASLPVLAFSSSSLERSKKYRDAGFDGFLPRPVSRRKLINMAERLLKQEKPQPEKKEKEPLMTRYTLVEEAKHSVRILLAEENLINRKLALFVLSKAGYRVKVARNGKEAVDMYTSAPNHYDLILMDIQMPVMDGKEATKRIRETEKEKSLKKIPIIAVTADVMKGEKEKLLALGMNDYVSKPIKREVVYEMVKKWTLKP
jgi:CheY-like chemotaxis protein